MNDLEINQIFITGTGKYMESLLSDGLGGVIFFSRDITSEASFCSFVQRVKSMAVGVPFLAIDQEGGRVERTENIYPKRLSAKYAYQKGKEFLSAQTREMAIELSNFGINLNFAPVADVNTNPLNPIIGERAFSDNAEDVIKGIEIVSDVYRKYDILSCVKHYPGHGDASVDSHKALPCIDLSLEEMEKIHLKPFVSASKLGIPMIMVAHLDCDCFGDKGVPTSLSKNAIDYLRNQIGFEGVIISDDMNMGGVLGIEPLEAAIRAIKAGVNILLYRDSDLTTYSLISAFKKQVKQDDELRSAVEQSVLRIKMLKQLLI